MSTLCISAAGKLGHATLNLKDKVKKHSQKPKTFNTHHSKMQKHGWAKYIPNFAFQQC